METDTLTVFMPFAVLFVALLAHIIGSRKRAKAQDYKLLQTSIRDLQEYVIELKCEVKELREEINDA